MFPTVDVLIFMTALFTSLTLVPALRRWALDSGSVDHPGPRKVHSQAIPRLGGVAIFLAFVFSLLAFVEMGREVRGILAGSLVVFIVGLIDDLYGLSARMKFAGEISAVLLTMLISRLYLERLGDLFGFGEVILPLWFSLPFTLFAVVGVINAINFIDGLDGLSGGVSLVALGAFFFLGRHVGSAGVMTLCAALAGAILGFLKYNFYPARIFMGDAGSLTVGFVLGFLAIFLTQGPGSTVNPMTPVLVLGLPIIDTVWVMARRLLQGKSPFAADMTHVHHKFLNLGLQHRFTVILIYAISLFWALVAVAAHDWPAYLLLPLYLLISAGCYLALRHRIIHRERYPFLALDSSSGLRESALYNRIAQAAEGVVPVLSTLFVVYLGMVTYAGFRSGGGRWPLGAVAFAGCAFLLLHFWRPRSRLLLALLYLAGLSVVFAAERQGGGELLPGVSLSRANDLIFAVMLLLVTVKVLFRRHGEFFVTSAEVTAFVVSIFLAVALSQGGEFPHFAGVLLRGGILFVAIKTIVSRDRFVSDG
jgi:UDP-GlcNAc:undecaprenyl-phosphate GlcNAc-1-phosphate transferase